MQMTTPRSLTLGKQTYDAHERRVGELTTYIVTQRRRGKLHIGDIEPALRGPHAGKWRGFVRTKRERTFRHIGTFTTSDAAMSEICRSYHGPIL